MFLNRKILGWAVAACAAASILLYGGRPAEAGLLGKTLDAVYYYPDASTAYSFAAFSPVSFVVGAGQETVGDVEGVTQLLTDFTDTTLTITLQTVLIGPTWNTVAFNGPIFTSPGPLGITGASVDPATTMAGFDNSRVSFTGNQILINWNGLSYIDGTVVKVDFAFAAVPEPASLALLATALTGIGLASIPAGRRRAGVRSASVG
jgi:hypothetical protein